MTKSQKEKNRSLIVFIALWSMIFVMSAILILAFFAKPLAELGVIALAFFSAMASVIGTNFFSKPSTGGDDPTIIEDYK